MVRMKAISHSDPIVFVGSNFFRLKDHFGTCPLPLNLIDHETRIYHVGHEVICYWCYWNITT